MAIENKDGTILITGEHIQVYRLLVLYQALKLESKGLKMSRHGSALATIKGITGLTGTRVTMIPKYEAWLKEHNILF